MKLKWKYQMMKKLISGNNNTYIKCTKIIVILQILMNKRKFDYDLKVPNQSLASNSYDFGY